MTFPTAKVLCRPRHLAPVVLALFVAGCAGMFERDDEPRFDEDRIHVRIINDNFYDVTVHADYDGRRERIGRVIGNRTEVFPLPRHITGGTRMSIVISVQAGGTFTTNPIVVWPGEEVEVRVPPDLDRR